MFKKKNVIVRQKKENYLTIKKYKEILKENYFENEVSSSNPIKSFFHSNRMKVIHNLVKKYYKPNLFILDIGCGNSLWNNSGLPITGIDASETMIKWGIKNNFLKYGIVSNFHNLPLKSNFVDIIILTEVIEHILDYQEFIISLKLILKKNGLLIVSVPKDTYFSLWKPLFKIQCLFQKYIKKNLYYYYECGHVNQFSKQSLSNLMLYSGFGINDLFTSSGLSIFGVFYYGE